MWVAKIYENCVSNYKITSGFGYRTHPISGDRAHHDGVDIISSSGDNNIYALEDGYVQMIRTDQNNAKTGYGNYIWVRYPRVNISLFYAHCKSIKLKKNDKVSKGDIIAIMGSTGASIGVHLHLGMTEIGSDKWINPETYNYNVESKIKNINGVKRDETKKQVKVLVDGLRVRKVNNINSDIIGYVLKNNVYDFYEVFKDDIYTWYKIGDDKWIADNGEFLDIYFVDDYKIKYEKLLEEYNKLNDYKFKYLAHTTCVYKIKLYENEELIIR